MYEVLGVLALFALVYSSIAGGIERTGVGGPIAFTVFVSLAGLGVRTATKLFMGWFGPRGLASIVFVVIVLNASLPGGRTLTYVVACTVIFGILVWLRGWLAVRCPLWKASTVVAVARTSST